MRTLASRNKNGKHLIRLLTLTPSTNVEVDAHSAWSSLLMPLPLLRYMIRKGFNLSCTVLSRQEAARLNVIAQI